MDSIPSAFTYGPAFPSTLNLPPSSPYSTYPQNRVRNSEYHRHSSIKVVNPDWGPVTLIAVSDSNLEGVVGTRGVSHVTTSFVFLRVSSLRFRVLLQV